MSRAIAANTVPVPDSASYTYAFFSLPPSYYFRTARFRRVARCCFNDAGTCQQSNLVDSIRLKRMHSWPPLACPLQFFERRENSLCFCSSQTGSPATNGIKIDSFPLKWERM